jgi:GTP-binding protein HflX
LAKKNPEPTLAPRERAFLVGVDLYQQRALLPLEDSLNELALLADTSGLEVVGELTQKLDRPHVKTYIGNPF